MSGLRATMDNMIHSYPMPIPSVILYCFIMFAFLKSHRKAKKQPRPLFHMYVRNVLNYTLAYWTAYEQSLLRGDLKEVK